MSSGENASCSVNGDRILPVGYRFYPTDEELVEYYLKRKVFDLPVPASVIPEFDVFVTDPWGLPGDLKEKRFFFSKRKNFMRRGAGAHAGAHAGAGVGVGCGIWKSMNGREKIIYNGVVFGVKKCMIFSQHRRHQNQETTRWFMHEYRLACSATFPNSTQRVRIELGEWAVYSLFEKRILPKEKEQVLQRLETKLEDTSENSSSSISSSDTESSIQEETSENSYSSIFSNDTESSIQEETSENSYSSISSNDTESSIQEEISDYSSISSNDIESSIQEEIS